MNAKDLPGRPDFVFDAERVALFADGCFWHGCPDCYRRPASSQDYWDAKVNKNMARDERNDSELIEMGWTPVHVWEHELADLENVRSKVLAKLNG